MSSKVDWLILVLATVLLSGCGTGSLSRDARIKLEYAQPTTQILHLVDVRPALEKSFRVGAIPGNPQSVALGDENFTPDRLRVLAFRLQNELGDNLKEKDEVLVERFEVFEYVRNIKTPTGDEVVKFYEQTGANFTDPATNAVMPLVIPIRQLMDRTITSVAEVDLRIKINGKPYMSKNSVALDDVNREYGVSEAFNFSFKNLIYDIEVDLKK